MGRMDVRLQKKSGMGQQRRKSSGQANSVGHRSLSEKVEETKVRNLKELRKKGLTRHQLPTDIKQT